MSVVLSQHLPLLATAPDGIQKLRGLILELAVRGKLVPQDQNDEPASELLRRIAKERARLEAEGTCKKTKATPLDGSDWPFELPIGWEWCRFPDVAHYKMGKTPPTKEAAYWADGGIPWVSISDMNHGQRIATTSRTISNAAREKVFRSPPESVGTLLMSFKLTVGKVATLGIDAFHNEAIISIFPFKGVSQEFLSHFLPMIAQGGNSKSALMGDTLNSESLALLSIPLPPLNEQHRIVAKVNELMALCDRLESEQTDATSAHGRLVETLLGTLTQSRDAFELAANWQRLSRHFDTLFSTETSLDALKQTILQLAVMGKLVPQDPDDEPASELLKQINLVKVQLLNANRLKKDKILWDGLAKAPPHSLPHNWAWTRLQDVFEISRGGSPRPAGAPQFFGGPIPWITVGEITKDENKYLLNTEGGLTEEGAKRSRFIDPGDLLLTNSGATLGVPKISLIRACMNDGVAVLRRFHPYDLNDFSYLYLFSQTGAFRNVNQGMGQPNLNTPIIASWYFPLPPLAEQHRIVAKVDELMALVDRLKAGLVESSVQQERLATTLIETAHKAA